MSEPRISVVIPNFNHGRFLPRCLDAHLNQPVQADEIIVVDDGSTDNSREVLEAYARKHPILRVYYNEKNSGTNFTANRGLHLATGDFVGFPAADDEVRPGIYEHFRKLLREHPETGLCSGMCEWRCTTTGLVWYTGRHMPDQACYLSPREAVALGRRGGLSISGQHAIYKKSALLAVGGYIPELKWFADCFCAYVATFRHGLCHVPEVLSNVYLYPNSYFNADARAHAKRRAAMDHLLALLESEPYADVTPLIRQSGVFGEFGWSMMRVAASQRRHWGFLTPGFAYLAARRSAGIIGRRFFPNWLAKWCLKIFYARR